MIAKRLNFDLSQLWENPDNLCVIRFKDLIEPTKNILATRIKETAPQWRIRNSHGPDIQTIYETLTELNPIIFSERQAEIRDRYYPRNSYRNFNFSAAHHISGYNYKNLCQALYFIICLKRRPFRRYEIQRIVSTVNSNWNLISRFMERFPQENTQPTEEPNNVETSEVGLDEIGQARQNAETHGANNIPIEMQERPPLKIMTKRLNGLQYKIKINPWEETTTFALADELNNNSY